MDQGSNDCKQVYFEYFSGKRHNSRAFNEGWRPGGEPFAAAVRGPARRDESRSTAQETGGAVPGAKQNARETCSLPSCSKFDLNVAANLTCFKTGFFS